MFWIYTDKASILILALFRSNRCSSVYLFPFAYLYKLTAILFSTPSRCFSLLCFPQRYSPPAFSPLLPIVAIYYAFVTQRGVWSPRGHSVLVPYGSLFTISQLRGYIDRYISKEHTLTRIIYSH